MSQVRLNHLMVLHVHKALTDTIKLESIADEFISSLQHIGQKFLVLELNFSVSKGFILI